MVVVVLVVIEGEEGVVEGAAEGVAGDSDEMASEERGRCGQPSREVEDVGCVVEIGDRVPKVDDLDQGLAIGETVILLTLSLHPY